MLWILFSWCQYGFIHIKFLKALFAWFNKNKSQSKTSKKGP